MEVCVPLIKDREVEKREIYSTQRTEQISAEIKWGICLLTYTNHSIQTWLTQESFDSLLMALIHQ